MKFNNLLILTLLCINSSFSETLTREEAIEKRLHPVAEYNVNQNGVVAVPTLAAASFDPIKKYNSVCAACHTTGAAGAPKLGDKGAWAARLEEPMDKVYAKAINGFKGMPPKGTCMSCSDDQIKQVVDYMVSKVK